MVHLWQPAEYLTVGEYTQTDMAFLGFEGGIEKCMTYQFLLSSFILIPMWFVSRDYNSYDLQTKMIYYWCSISKWTCIVHFVTCVNAEANLLISQG